jgi:predicted ATPase/DNA-binding SARP family transcriptional activator
MSLLVQQKETSPQRPAVAPATQRLTLARVSTSLFAEFVVAVDGVAVAPERWRLKHVRALWQMLCLAPGHRLSRDETTEALWPQAGAQASSNRLHHTLHALRGIFGDAGLVDVRERIVLQAGTLWLDSHMGHDIDVVQFRRAVQAVRHCSSDEHMIAALQAAAAWCRGPLVLPAAAGDWFAPHGQALLRDHVWVLEQLAQRHRVANRLDDAVQALEDLVRVEPSNEAAHRGLIELYDSQGRADLAAQQYAACSRYLRRDSGALPSAVTQRQIADISLRARQRLPSINVAAVLPDPPLRQRFVAPKRATPLLGRDGELDLLRQWLCDDQSSRLVTLVAAGGIGKTRLATAFAEEVQDHFADGVCFVAMGTAQRPSRLAERCCQALGLPLQERPAEELLMTALADKHLLLVLDRFEHLQDAAPQLAMWLQAAPRLRMLVTSQCPLKLRAERVHALQPLLGCRVQAALELFVMTARHAGVELDANQSESTIRGVCECLGGNTLAIELAAAQLRSVPLDDLASALRQPLGVLAGVAPDDDPQHASLQATIGWSVSLLPPPAARLLAMSSVFAGDFSADDARVVLGPFFDAAALQPLLRNLLDRHLLFRRGDGEDGEAGPFALADAVREHARQMACTVPQWAQVQSAHVQHCAALAKSLFDGTGNGSQDRARSFFLAAAADIEQALQHAHRDGPLETYLRMCWQSASLQMDYGLIQRAIECLKEAVAVPVREREECDCSAWCRYMLACALGQSGVHRAAIRPLREAQRLARGSADQALHLKLAYGLAYVWSVQLLPDKSLRAIDDLIRTSERVGHTVGFSGYYMLMAACREMQGRFALAVDAAQHALEWAHRNQRPRDSLIALILLAEIETMRGELGLAEQCLQEAQLLSDAAYAALRRFDLDLTLGILAFERCQFVVAEQHFEQGLAISQTSFGNRGVAARVWHDSVLIETGRETEAQYLLSLGEAELPFESDYIVACLRARGYRLQLQALHNDWPAVIVSVQQLKEFAQRTGNVLWASWLAESAALAAHCLGQRVLALRLLEQSKALHSRSGALATPRQRASWARVQARLRDTSHETAAPQAAELARLLTQLSEGFAGRNGGAEVARERREPRSDRQPRHEPLPA